MAESFRERTEREAREMDAALRSAFASAIDDRALRDRLEALAQKPRFAEFTWFWGPSLSTRNRVLFRPLILSNFSSFSLNAEGALFDPWKGDTAAPLERWLQALDAADDVQLTRRLYAWRLQHTPRKRREATWCQDVLARFSSARSPAARITALAKVDTGWMSLDAKTALRLYEIDRAPARPFILGHLPAFGWLGEKRRDWEELLRRSRERDPDFHFDLYRLIVEEKQWRADALELCRSVPDPAALDSELERRHPRSRIDGAADVFHELVRARQRDVVPYIIRHVASIFPRFGFPMHRQASGLRRLLATASEEGWLDLWAALLKTSAPDALFDSEVMRPVRSTALTTAEVHARLVLIAGHGREAHFASVSFAQVHPLEEATALELYRLFPDLVRGPYRMHVAPGWHGAYPKLVRTAIERADTELVDYLASRAGIQEPSRRDPSGWKETLESLASHFEALPDPEFVRRGSNALSRMPAFAVWNYDQLLRTNRLARLLFERSTALYLSDAKAVRDLLESPQIHVQALAFRILGRDDPRAGDIAANLPPCPSALQVPEGSSARARELLLRSRKEIDAPCHVSTPSRPHGALEGRRSNEARRDESASKRSVYFCATAKAPSSPRCVAPIPTVNSIAARSPSRRDQRRGGELPPRQGPEPKDGGEDGPAGRRPTAYAPAHLMWREKSAKADFFESSRDFGRQGRAGRLLRGARAPTTTASARSRPV